MSYPLSKDLQQVLTVAKQYAIKGKSSSITCDHLLVACCTDPYIQRILLPFGSVEIILGILERSLIINSGTKQVKNPKLSPKAQHILKKAGELCAIIKQHEIIPFHLFCTVLTEGSYTSTVAANIGITTSSIKQSISPSVSPINIGPTFNVLPLFCKNVNSTIINQHTQCVGRDKEVDTLISRLLKPGLPCIALLGKKNSGKTSIVYKIADMINKRKIEEYESWVRCEQSKKQKVTWIPPSLDGLTDANLQIAKWICSNIRQNRPFKAPQLYIHGPRNLGKTSLVEWLEKSLSVYHMPTTEEFYDHYSDDYDLVVIDEFKGQKTIQFLNQFLQGSNMPIRKKGSQGMKSKNLPVVILSNYALSECYVKAANDGRLNTLECRLEIVEIDSFIDFYKRHDDII